MKKLIVLLLMFGVGAKVASSHASVSITPSKATLGNGTNGIVFLNLNNDGAGEELVAAYGNGLMCQKELLTTKPDEWFLLETVAMFIRTNPFPVCVWPKGEYHSRSCAQITYDATHENYNSPDEWPTDEWLDHFNTLSRCVDSQGVYLPMVIK